MKKLIACFLLISLLLCACSDKTPSLKVTVKITVADSESGFSGVVYENSSYKYALGTPTIDGVLTALTKAGKIDYFFDGNFIKVGDFDFYDAPDNSYTRAWVVTLNGETPENGVLAEIKEGDVIELNYIVFIHYFPIS
jgi:hypothetical protein